MDTPRLGRRSLWGDIAGRRTIRGWFREEVQERLCAGLGRRRVCLLSLARAGCHCWTCLYRSSFMESVRVAFARRVQLRNIPTG